MGERIKEEGVRVLKKMMLEKSSDETVGEVLVKFCSRSGLSMETCTEYYELLVDEGEIEEV